MAFVHNVNVLVQSLSQRRAAAQQQLHQREQQHQQRRLRQQPPHDHTVHAHSQPQHQHQQQQQQQVRPARVATACRRRPRMAALEAPVKEDLRSKLNNLLAQTVSESETSKTEGDKQRQKVDPGKMYKVLIYNDEVHSKDYVTKVLLKVIPGLTQDHAWRIMNEAHSKGRAIVGVWIFEISEGYCDMLRNNGLRSDIEVA